MTATPTCGCRLEVADDGVRLVVCDSGHVLRVDCPGGPVDVNDLEDQIEVWAGNLREWFDRHENAVPGTIAIPSSTAPMSPDSSAWGEPLVEDKP